MRRVTAFLPIGTAADLQAAIAISTWLRGLGKSLPDLSVTGGTISSLSRPAFHGFYYSTKLSIWIEEAVSMLILDVPYEGKVLSDFVELLEIEFLNFYDQFESGQEKIGLASFTLDFASYDGSRARGPYGPD